uniref:Kinesin-like protein n=1 Tax=Panagrolaimus davidi TaxID=227884 RepID=A0A914PY07_9BILA
MNHLWRGWDQRKVAETSMNRESSRSHAVFMLTLITERTDGAVVNSRSSRLNLVDLAGSERQGQTHNTGEQLKEAGSINNSLSILARIIRTVSTSKEGTYVGYRDSLLTHLLRDSLGGNAKTTVIVNIHPNAEFIGDTGSTLTFAVNCKKVKNTAHVNVAISCKDVESLKKLVEKNEHLLKENEKLQEELAEQKEIYVLEKNQREAADNEFAKMKNEYELIIKNIMDELNKEKLEKVQIEKERDEAAAAQKHENLSQNCTNLREKMIEGFDSDISTEAR